MKPKEVGFDGKKGLNLNLHHVPGGGIYKLRGGNHLPEVDKYNFRNQLLWIESDDDAKLCYCNQNNQLFELDFIPVEL